MKRNPIDNVNELIKTLYAFEKKEIHSTRSLLDEIKWKKFLTSEEIHALNEAYDKFYFSIPMLILEAGVAVPRITLWERFLINEEPKKGFLRRAWDKISGKQKWEKDWADADASRAAWYDKQRAASQTPSEEIDVDVSEFSKDDKSAKGNEEAKKLTSEKCDFEQIKNKLMSVIKKMKYAPSAYDRVVSRVMKSIQGAPQTSSVYGLKRLIKSKNPKMRNSSAEIFATAIEDCYGESEKSDVPTSPEKNKDEVFSSGELDKLATLVFDDFNDYLAKAHDKKSTYKRLRPVGREGIKKVVNILKDNEKLSKSYDAQPSFASRFANLAAYGNADMDASLKKSLENNRSIVNSWVSKNSKMMDDIRDATDGNDLPIWLLANRKAIVEMILLIQKYANELLIERNRNVESKLLTERWQKLAGLIRG